ncbi:MAG TPA: Tic22 family protein, partial [Candidatus Obscuribacterales bacterium]
MRSLMRWSTALGIVAGSLAGAVLTGTMPALALTEEQVMERLRSVPVFTITDESGSPLVAAPESATESGTTPGVPVAGVFISQDDAENFLNNLQSQNPDLASNVQVVPVSLAEVYQLAVTSRQESAGVEFVFVPMVAEVESAVDILRTQGQDVNEFEGVPLFIARSLEGEGGFLTIESGQEATAQGEPERF